MNPDRVATTILSLTLLLAAALSSSGCRGTQNWLSRKKEHSPPQELLAVAKTDRVTLSDEQTFDVEFAMARTLEQQGDLTRAERAYRALLERKHDRPYVFHRLAVVCDRQNRFQDAEQNFKRAIALEPRDSVLLADYGYSLYRQRRWVESEQYLRQAVANDPADSRAHNHLGLVLCQVERRDEAIGEFLRAGCTEAEAHVNLALVLTMNDRFEEARHEYAIASQIGVSSPEAIERARQLDKLLAQAGVLPASVSLASGTQSLPEASPSSSHVGRSRVLVP